MRVKDKSVVDAKRSAVITISATDVRKGSLRSPAGCAAALACKRELHATEARIHVGRCYLKIADKWVRYRTSQALRSEIIAFDRGGTFAPGEYTLKTIPKRQYKSERITKPKGGTETHVKIKRPFKKYHQITGVREKAPNN